MSQIQRRCKECGFPIEARIPFCPACRSTYLMLVGGPAVADLGAPEERVQARPYPLYEEPMVRCLCCHNPIQAAEAYHSRYAGQAVCWTCKRAEEA